MLGGDGGASRYRRSSGSRGRDGFSADWPRENRSLTGIHDSGSRGNSGGDSGGVGGGTFRSSDRITGRDSGGGRRSRRGSRGGSGGDGGGGGGGGGGGVGASRSVVFRYNDVSGDGDGSQSMDVSDRQSLRDPWIRRGGDGFSESSGGNGGGIRSGASDGGGGSGGSDGSRRRDLSDGRSSRDPRIRLGGTGGSGSSGGSRGGSRGDGGGSWSGGGGGSRFSRRSAASLPSHEEGYIPRRPSTVNDSYGDRSTGRYRSGDRSSDRSGDRAWESFTADRSRRKDGPASREHASSRDRPVLSFDSKTRSEDPFSDPRRLGDLSEDRFTDRSRYRVADRSRRLEYPASGERDAPNPSALSIDLRSTGSRQRSSHYSRERYRDQCGAGYSRRMDDPASRERAITPDRPGLSTDCKNRSVDHSITRLRARAGDRTGDHHRSGNLSGECSGNFSGFRSGDRPGDQYADRSDDSSFRRQDNPASGKRALDRSARPGSRYTSKDLSRESYRKRSRDRSGEHSRDRYSGAHSSRARSGITDPRPRDRATKYSGGGGGGGGGGYIGERYRDGVSDCGGDGGGSGSGVGYGYARADDCDYGRSGRGDIGGYGGDRERKRRRTAGSPSAKIAATTANTGPIHRPPATSREDSWSGGGRQELDAVAAAMAGRDSSPRFEDGYLSSSDSGRSCSAPPPARRLPRDENATPWGEETCSPFRRLSVSDRRGGGRQGGEELQRQDQQPQKQQHSPARPPQPPQQQVYTPPPKKQQPEQQPEQQQEKQLPSNVLGNKPDFMAEGGAADGETMELAVGVGVGRCGVAWGLGEAGWEQEGNGWGRYRACGGWVRLGWVRVWLQSVVKLASDREKGTPPPEKHFPPP